MSTGEPARDGSGKSQQKLVDFRPSRCSWASPQPSALNTIPPCASSRATKPLAAEAPRYYQIALHQDLLGGWTLTREWGQQGGRWAYQA